jgi:PAS domain S-box-containing protein
MKDKLKKLVPTIERELKEYENRKQAKKEHLELIESRNSLKESEHKYRTLANSGRALIWQEDADGATSYFNQVWLNFTGRKLKEELGDGWMDSIHPHDINQYLNSCSTAWEKRLPFSLEYRLKRYDGEYRWIIDEGTPRYNLEGEFIGYIGHCLDISDRKKAEMKLQNANTIINRSPSVVFRWMNDEHWTVFHVSENVYKIFGYSSDDFYKKEIIYSDLILKDDLERVISEVAYYSNQKDLDSFSHKFYRIVTKDGLVKWIKDDTFIVRNEDDVIICYEGIISDVTDLVNSELLVAESEKKFRSLAENSGDRIERYDKECRHSYINPESLRISGFNYEDVIGKTHKELGYPAIDYEYWDSLIINVFNTGHPNGCVLDIKSEKQINYYDWKLYPEYDDKGSVFSVLSVSRDITKIKESEMELKRAHEKLVRGEKIANIGNWELDFKTGKMEASEGARKIYGLPIDTKIYLGQIQKCVVSEYRPMLDKALKELVDYHFGYDVEFKIITADKHEIKDLRSIAVYDQDLKKIFGIIQDVSEIKKAHHELNKLSTAVNQSPSIVVLTDLNGIVEYVNPKFTEITGYTHNEVLNKNPRILKSGEMSDEVYHELWTSVLSGKTWKGEFQNRKKSGELYWEGATIAPVMGENGKIINFLKVSQDITDKKQMEANLLKEKISLENSNRELEQFAYIASHDLQEPLRIVSSFSQLLELKHSHRLNNEAKEYIDYIVTGAKRMQNLIRGLLEYSRISSKEKQKKMIRLSEPLKDAIYNLNLSISEAGAEVIINEMPEVFIEPDQIAHVFQNIIGNALKFRRDDVKCVIEISSVFDKEKNEWIISVRDNGIGIDKKYFEKVFVIFNRLESSESKAGEGIGLALCKRIIDRHSGRIWVESEGELKGSVFFFTIPNEKRS